MIWPRKKGPTINLEVEGMRCAHCEATIKIALRNFPAVRNVKIQKKRNVEVEILPGQIVSTEQLAAAIEQTGYKVISTVNSTTA